MAYLDDSWIWLSAAQGFLLVAIGGIYAGWLNRYAGATKSRKTKTSDAFAAVAALGLPCYLAAGLSLSIGYLRSRFGAHVDPYTLAYAVGCILGTPSVWWYAIRWKSGPNLPAE